MKNADTPADRKAGKKRNVFIVDMKRNYSYYLMMLPAALLVFLFSYLPMRGMVIAFQDYNVMDRYSSPFVGWANFKFFFTSSYAYRTTFNTIFINLNYLVWTTILSVLFAIMLNEIRSKLAMKFYQNLMFLPYFFSAVVIGKLVTTIVFSDQNGIANQILHLFGHDPIVWSQVAGPWGWIIIGTHIWKTVGYSSIIYLASIAGIDDHLYEAAALDGANRWQQIRKITLPMLTPVIIIMTLLNLGGMLRGDFDTIYSIIGDNGLLFQHTDVIDTYIFRAIKQAADFGPTAAVGLYQSVVGFILVFGSNALVRRFNKDNSLF
ncbi:sugar ABC transporter permease [Paenibacillus lycopersici]|uniref:Sugar ABC transporter permease n=1 Tax=Paenibacillus lycopersici TaxID=2704462 RepID=A0A6C0G5M8_9BACL|nr:ABC transporter permease subunit [Paenibacillus lycopersici]QHT62979.1 sugar ABC transporter permease [Paenibacillus lycopersici]